MPEQALPVLINTEEGRSKNGEIRRGQSVRRVPTADLDLCFRDRQKFEKKYGEISEFQRNRIRWAMNLGQAIAERSLPKLEKAFSLMIGVPIQMAPSRFMETDQPLRSLADLFNPVLADTHLCVWWSEIGQRLVWGVHCPSIVEALFVLALASVGDLGALGRCKRCQELFFRVRPSKKYCSDRCQAADGMRRKRNREKRQAQARKGSKP